MTNEERMLQMRQAGSAATDALAQVTTSISDALEEKSRQIAQVAQEALAELSPKMRKATTILGVHGWFPAPDLSLSSLTTLADMFNPQDTDAADSALMDYYRERLPKITVDVMTWYPSRDRVLASAFAAHQRCEYVLSIPAFLAQADGICQERFGVRLYSRSKGAPRTAAEIEARKLADDVIVASVLNPKMIPLPISASADELAHHPTALNRHEVLHGMSLDYGTEVNGWKAISWLYYVAWKLREYKTE